MARQSNGSGLCFLRLGPGEGERYVVVVNYSDHQGQCRLRQLIDGLAGRTVRLVDVMGSEAYDRDGTDLVESGLFIDLGAWRYNVFKLEFVEQRK